MSGKKPIIILHLSLNHLNPSLAQNNHAQFFNHFPRNPYDNGSGPIFSRKLAIAPKDWHLLKANRKAQAGQELAAALVFLLKDQPEEALSHIQQAAGWLDRSISAPPCPDHGR